MKILHYFTITIFIIMSCKSPEAGRPISQTTGSFIKTSVSRNKDLIKLEEKLIQEYMINNSENNYIASEYGFWYYYVTTSKVEGESPKFGDILNFNYTISNFKNQPIYTEEELGNQVYNMDKEELFTGLREGLKLMKVGETIVCLFPSQKAFGFYGDENKIGMNTPLICSITLNLITKNK